MSLYGTQVLSTEEQYGKSDSVLEAFIVDEIIRLPKEDIQKFTESEECKILVEKSVLKKPTLIRLGREDEEKRRIKLIAYQMAKDAKDPEFEKLKKYTALRKQSIKKIMKKYGGRATKSAKIATKNYIKAMSVNKDVVKQEK